MKTKTPETLEIIKNILNAISNSPGIRAKDLANHFSIPQNVMASILGNLNKTHQVYRSKIKCGKDVSQYGYWLINPNPDLSKMVKLQVIISDLKPINNTKVDNIVSELEELTIKELTLLVSKFKLLTIPALT
jgi:hypothetical protein